MLAIPLSQVKNDYLLFFRKEIVQNLNRTLRKGKLCVAGVLVSNVAAGVSSNPDATLLLFKSLRSGRVRLVPRVGKTGRYKEILGKPDWLLEVVSDGSVQKDTEKLPAAYHRAEVSEYWLVDARGDTIDFRIRGYLRF